MESPCSSSQRGRDASDRDISDLDDTGVEDSAPEEALARFNHFNRLSGEYFARFLLDGSCQEELIYHLDQARAHIPPQIVGSLFGGSQTPGFGDAYRGAWAVIWRSRNTLQSARQLVEAFEWKFRVAPDSRTLEDIVVLSSVQAEIYQKTHDGEDLLKALETYKAFWQLYANSNIDADSNQAKDLCFQVILSCTQLLYEDFRRTGKYFALDLSINLASGPVDGSIDDERRSLETRVQRAFIAYCFNQAEWDVSREKHEVCDWSFLYEKGSSSTVPETSTLQLDQSDELYSHVPLESDNSQIRLLQLQAGVWDDPIACFLEVVDLGSAPYYDALSYVCGHPAVTESITLHGKSCNVTVNLYDALKRLRKPDKHRRLWVDALCIHQDDTKEKERQIGLMGEIYSKAREVCMWLGEPAAIKAFSDVSAEIPCHVAAAKMLEKAIPRTYPKIRPYLNILEDDDFQKISKHSILDLTPILYQLPFSMRPINSAPDDSLLSGSVPRPHNRVFPQHIMDGLEAITNGDLCMGMEEVVSRNAWFDAPEKELTANVYWGSELQIPFNLESKHSGLDWPICGAFVLVNLFVMDMHFHDLPFFNEMGRSGKASATAQAWNKSCYTLYQILKSNYWQRAWTLQEVVLAQEPTIYFGKHVLPLCRLILAMHNFNNHYQTCCKGVVSESEITDCRSSSWWMKLHEAVVGSFDRTCHMWLLRLQKILEREDASLQYSSVVQSIFRKRTATNPRDLVYSTLGLLKNEEQGALSVDYSMSIEDTFVRAMTKAMSECEYYEVFFHSAESGRSIDLKYKLPSWCMDLSLPLGMGEQHVEMSSKFDAFPNVTGTAELQRDSCLAVTSAKVDVVARISSVSQCCARGGWEDTIHNIRRWREFAALDQDLRNISIDTTEAAFWKTILGDLLLPTSSTLHADAKLHERISGPDLDLVPNWQAWLHDPKQKPETPSYPGFDMTNSFDVEWYSRIGEFSRLDRRLHISMKDKRLFVTGKGRLGTAGGNKDLDRFTSVQEGDEVHLVQGCRVPVILRPIDSVMLGGEKYGNDPAAFSADLKSCTHESSSVYQLVGLCYVHGIMDGEATKENGFCPSRIYLR